MSDDRKLSPPRISWLKEPTFDPDGVQIRSGLDSQGREHPDPVPMAPPAGFTAGPDQLHTIIRRMVAEERYQAAIDAEGFETFAEAEDFDVDDDLYPVDPQTPYEEVFNPPPQGEGGRSPTLAGEAPNGGNRAPEDATRQPPSQTASAGSSLSASPAPTVQTPTSASADGSNTGVKSG